MGFWLDFDMLICTNVSLQRTSIYIYICARDLLGLFRSFFTNAAWALYNTQWRLQIAIKTGLSYRVCLLSTLCSMCQIQVHHADVWYLCTPCASIYESKGTSAIVDFGQAIYAAWDLRHLQHSAHRIELYSAHMWRQRNFCKSWLCQAMLMYATWILDHPDLSLSGGFVHKRCPTLHPTYSVSLGISLFLS